MKTFRVSAAIFALLYSAQAVKVNTQAEPDVFGPNGHDYQNDSAKYDLSRIGIDITQRGAGKEACKEGDWTTVHWVGSLKDGRVVTSSRDEPGGLPKTFALGNQQVLKCWDLALTHLHQGDHASVTCPSFYAYGGAFTPSPMGGEPIPLHSDIDFDLEVVECNRVPSFTEQVDQPVTTTLQPEQCFYFHLEKSESTAYDLVLSTDNEDWGWWWPARYIKIETKVVDDEQQQWFQDADGSIHNAANPDYYLDVDYGHVMVAKVGDTNKNTHAGFPKQKRKWYFDPIAHALTTQIEGIKSELAIHDQPKNWAYAEVAPSALLQGKDLSQWKIEYCWNKNYGPQGQEYYDRHITPSTPSAPSNSTATS